MSQLLIVAVIGIFLCASVTDIRSRKIPNELVLALAVAGFLRLVMSVISGAGLVSAGVDLAVAGCVFAAGAALFAAGLMGGGDTKLLAAAALWFGAAGTLQFLVATALAGGLLACLFVVRRGVHRFSGGVGSAAAESLPYGVAIAVGGILVSAQGL